MKIAKYQSTAKVYTICGQKIEVNALKNEGDSPNFYTTITAQNSSESGISNFIDAIISFIAPNYDIEAVRADNISGISGIGAHSKPNSKSLTLVEKSSDAIHEKLEYLQKIYRDKPVQALLDEKNTGFLVDGIMKEVTALGSAAGLVNEPQLNLIRNAIGKELKAAKDYNKEPDIEEIMKKVTALGSAAGLVNEPQLNLIQSAVHAGLMVKPPTQQPQV